MIIKNYAFNSYLNYDDLNRIEDNIKECYSLVFGEENLSNVSIRNDRDNTTYDTCNDFNRIEKNIKKMMDSIENPYYEKIKTTWKDYDIISYKDLNRIENAIKYIYEFYSKSKAIVIYPGNKYLAQELI